MKLPGRDRSVFFMSRDATEGFRIRASAASGLVTLAVDDGDLLVLVFGCWSPCTGCPSYLDDFEPGVRRFVGFLDRLLTRGLVVRVERRDPNVTSQGVMTNERAKMNACMREQNSGLFLTRWVFSDQTARAWQ